MGTRDWPVLTKAHLDGIKNGSLKIPDVEVALHGVAEELQWLSLYSTDEAARAFALRTMWKMIPLKAELVRLRELLLLLP